MELTETIEKLAQYFGLTSEQITEKCKKREIVQSRQMVGAYMSLFIQGNKKDNEGNFIEKEINLSKIAASLHYYLKNGKGDHSSIVHCKKAVQSLWDTDRKFKQDWQKFCEYADSVLNEQLNELVEN